MRNRFWEGKSISGKKLMKPRKDRKKHEKPIDQITFDGCNITETVRFILRYVYDLDACCVCLTDNLGNQETIGLGDFLDEKQKSEKIPKEAKRISIEPADIMRHYPVSVISGQTVEAFHDTHFYVKIEGMAV